MTQFFTTSDKQKIPLDSPEYIKAIIKVADDKRQNALAIYEENAYASHVTEETKLDCYNASMKLADDIENGDANHTFWLWQRVNTELTGKCVAFLS